MFDTRDGTIAAVAASLTLAIGALLLGQGPGLGSSEAPRLQAPRLEGVVVAVHADGTESIVSGLSAESARKPAKCKKNDRRKRCRKQQAAPATAPTPVTPVPAAPTPVPLATPAPVSGGGNPAAYTFMAMSTTGTPVRWDKCKPVRYRINPAHVTQPMLDDVFEALRRASAASGIVFEYAGTTDVVPFATANWYEPLYDLTSDTSLYIAFSDEAQVPQLAGSVVGLAGPLWKVASDGSSKPVAVLGGAVFEVTDLPSGFPNGRSRGAVLLHELGHVLNLGHVDDSAQMMYPQLRAEGPTDYQAGDRTGLNTLAALPCEPA